MGYGQTGAIDADAVAEVAVIEDFGSVGDGEGCSAVLGLRVELGDDWMMLELTSLTISLYRPPIISTIPVNIVKWVESVYVLW